MPGTGCTWMPAPSSVSRAVVLRRGSTTMSPPAARALCRCERKGGIVSPTFEPRSSTVSAVSRSVSGKGRPRSMPNARFAAAAADDMQKRPL